MKGYIFKGDVKDVVAEIKKEAEKYKGYTVYDYVRMQDFHMVIARQIKKIFEKKNREVF